MTVSKLPARRGDAHASRLQLGFVCYARDKWLRLKAENRQNGGQFVRLYIRKQHRDKPQSQTGNADPSDDAGKDQCMGMPSMATGVSSLRAAPQAVSSICGD